MGELRKPISKETTGQVVFQEKQSQSNPFLILELLRGRKNSSAEMNPQEKARETVPPLFASKPLWLKAILKIC